MIVTIICTATIVSAGMGAYFGLQSSMTQMKDNQESQNKIMDLRIRALEDQQKLINIEVRELQNRGR